MRNLLRVLTFLLCCIVATWSAAQPAASIQVIDPNGAEDFDGITFRISLDNPAPVGGLEVETGIDASVMPPARINDFQQTMDDLEHVMFGEGESTVDLTLIPMGNRVITECREIARLEIRPGLGGYTIGSPNFAEGVVEDKEITRIEVSDNTASEAGDTGAFKIVLEAEAARNIIFNYTVNGTAIEGEDYENLTGSNLDGTGSIMVSTGATESAPITFTPTPDAEDDDNETVVLTLTGTDPAGCQLNQSPATITIMDGSTPSLPTVE